MTAITALNTGKRNGADPDNFDFNPYAAQYVKRGFPMTRNPLQSKMRTVLPY